MLKKKTILYLAIGWSLLIIFLSLVSLSSIKDPIKVPYKDKAVHFVFYFVFVLLWKLWNFKTSALKYSWIILLIAILLGISIEYCQSSFTSDRKFEILDIVANTFGALIGYIVTEKIIKSLKSHL